MAGYKPQVILQDTLSATHLDDIKPTPFSKNTSMNINQNKISISVNMRLYDNGKLSKEHEVLQYKKMALNSQRAYAIKEQKMQFRLAKANIKAIRAKLKSAQKELRFAKKNFEKVKKMYENGIVDNISFLDAMNAKTLAVAKYKETKYDLEVAKAMLYYYAGRDIKRVIR
jgi:outer membrane protein TolC